MKNKFKHSLKTEQLKARSVKSEIDYFKIPADELANCGFNVSKHIPSITRYMTVENLEGFEMDTRETVVLNLQTGLGKTTVCYKLIEDFAKQGFIVLVASPYRKLVDKDYDALKTIPGISAFNYHQVEEMSLTDYLEADLYDQLSAYLAPFIENTIHVMTINCLLQNPGEGSQRQGVMKRIYLDALLERCKNQGKKVVIFMDEIHDSIKNFHFDLIPNLIRWEPVIHKCFLSSATFTPASIPIIKFASLLTAGNINIYEVPRFRIVGKGGGDDRANLHLHFIGMEYGSRNLYPLMKLQYLIHQYKATHKITILTAQKGMTDSLMDKANSSSIAKKVQELNPVILTADTSHKNMFDDTNHNIGTNFGTGVNIEGSDKVLMIVLPYSVRNRANLGIFTDGVPPIIQSLARIRGKGHIHIFLSKPDRILDGQDLGERVPDVLTRNTLFENYIPQNKGTDELRNVFDFIRSQRSDTIGWIKDHQFSKQNPNGFSLGYVEPTFEQELIEDGQRILARNYASFGGDLSSYILWAAMKEQFCNARLTEVTFTSSRYNKVELKEHTLFEDLNYFISDEVFDSIKKEPFTIACSILAEHTMYSFVPVKDDDDNEIKEQVHNEFTYKGKKYTFSEVKRQTWFKKTLLRLLVYHWSGKKVREIEPKNYVLTCINNAIEIARTKTTDSCTSPDLVRAYLELNKVRIEFCRFIESNAIKAGGRKAIPMNIYQKLPNPIIKDIEAVKIKLNKLDHFIRGDTIPFLNASDGKSGSEYKKSLFHELKRYFTNIGSKPIKINGKEEFYPIHGHVIRELNPPLNTLVLLS